MMDEMKQDISSIHESHRMVETITGDECAECWACVCHQMNRLSDPCKGLTFDY